MGVHFTGIAIYGIDFIGENKLLLTYR